MIKLVVFDLDGTLVDSVSDLADAVNTSLVKYGFEPHSVEKYYGFVGNGTLKLIERALGEKQRDRETVERVHKAFADEYREHCLDKTGPYDGIGELLLKLDDMGIKTAVASNKTDEFTKTIVDKLFCGYDFYEVSGSKDGVPKKPDPQIVLSIMKRGGFSEGETLYVGDSDVDVMTGHNAKLAVCGCEWGFRGAEELKNAGADYLLHKPDELLEIIKILNRRSDFDDV